MLHLRAGSHHQEAEPQGTAMRWAYLQIAGRTLAALSWLLTIIMGEKWIGPVWWRKLLVYFIIQIERRKGDQ